MVLGAHGKAGQQPEGLGALHQQQLLLVNAAGVQALDRLGDRPPARVVRQQQAAAAVRRPFEGLKNTPQGLKSTRECARYMDAPFAKGPRPLVEICVTA